MKSDPKSWDALFSASKESSSEERVFYTLIRHGEELLAVPDGASFLKEALSLYSPQTFKARTAKSIFQLVLSTPLAGLLPHRKVTIQTNPFANFLFSVLEKSAAPSPLSKAKGAPCFSVLSGNPGTRGRRFVFLLFDDLGTPACVVKVGLDHEAQSLVRREADFLEVHSPGFSTMPGLVGRLDTEQFSALALPFLAGPSPSADCHADVKKILSSWLSKDKPIALGDIPAWQGLPVDSAIPEKKTAEMVDRLVTPSLMHGDFAPWNLRVGPSGRWTALDWERGQDPGVPGWDWFHYVVQTSLLVQNDSPEEILQRLEKLWMAPEFQAYAESSGIKGLEMPLLAGYLIHAKHLQQAEGSEQIEQLLSLVSRKIFPS